MTTQNTLKSLKAAYENAEAAWKTRAAEIDAQIAALKAEELELRNVRNTAARAYDEAQRAEQDKRNQDPSTYTHYELMLLHSNLDGVTCTSNYNAKYTTRGGLNVDRWVRSLMGKGILIQSGRGVRLTDAGHSLLAASQRPAPAINHIEADKVLSLYENDGEAVPFTLFHFRSFVSVMVLTQLDLAGMIESDGDRRWMLKLNRLGIEFLYGRLA